MLSNAIDFRTRRKQRPKSADFENPEDEADTRSQVSSTSNTASTSNGARSASVTDILECVSLSPGTRDPLGLPPRVLEGRNSAPDMLAGDIVGSATLGSRHARARSRLSAAASAKQKLSTRWKWTKEIFKISGNFCPLSHSVEECLSFCCHCHKGTHSQTDCMSSPICSLLFS